MRRVDLGSVEGLVSMRWFARVLAFLLAIDVVLILLFFVIGLRTPGTDMPLWADLREDWSAGEIANYVKWLAAAVALGFAWARSRRTLFLACAGVFLVLLADDMLQIHERFGGFLVRWLDVPERIGPLRGQDLGEILTWALLGVPVLLMIAVGFRYAGRSERALGLGFLALLAVLLAVGMVADVLSVAIKLQLEGTALRVVSGGMGVVEDGGEMIVASALCALAVAIGAAHLGSLRGSGAEPGRQRELPGHLFTSPKE